MPNFTANLIKKKKKAAFAAKVGFIVFMSVVKFLVYSTTGLQDKSAGVHSKIKECKQYMQKSFSISFAN